MVDSGQLQDNPKKHKMADLELATTPLSILLWKRDLPPPPPAPPPSNTDFRNRRRDCFAASARCLPRPVCRLLASARLWDIKGPRAKDDDFRSSRGRGSPLDPTLADEGEGALRTKSKAGWREGSQARHMAAKEDLCIPVARYARSADGRLPDAIPVGLPS